MPAINKGAWSAGALVVRKDNGSVRKYYQGEIYTYRQDGLKDSCYAAQPAVGSTFNGFIVQDSTVEPTGDGNAILTVICDNRNGNAVLDVDWQQIQKPLELHPRYNGGTFTMDALDWQHVHAALAGQDQVYNHTTQDYDDTDVTSGGRADAFAKMRGGNTSYMVFAPVARSTVINYLILTVGNLLGTLSSSPPFSGAPSGYQWLKVTDRGHKDGGYWERVEEWLGADSWDAQLYS